MTNQQITKRVIITTKTYENGNLVMEETHEEIEYGPDYENKWPGVYPNTPWVISHTNTASDHTHYTTDIE